MPETKPILEVCSQTWSWLDNERYKAVALVADTPYAAVRNRMRFVNLGQFPANMNYLQSTTRIDLGLQKLATKKYPNPSMLPYTQWTGGRKSDGTQAPTAFDLDRVTVNPKRELTTITSGINTWGYTICLLILPPDSPDLNEAEYNFGEVKTTEMELNNMKLEKLTNVLNKNFMAVDTVFKAVVDEIDTQKEVWQIQTQALKTEVKGIIESMVNREASVHMTDTTLFINQDDTHPRGGTGDGIQRGPILQRDPG